MKNIGCHAGHGKLGLGTVGAAVLLNESYENRLINAEIIKLLKENGITAFDNTVDSGTQTEILNNIIKKCNSRPTDLEISIHFNACVNDLKGDGKTTGVECFVYNTTSATAQIAKRINQKIAAFGFKDRGVKDGKHLGFVSKAKAPAILVEICFVDDKDDADLYNKVGYNAISKAIVEAILNKTIETVTTANTLYKVQIGSFASKENADKLAEELKAKGYACVVVAEE